MLQHRLAPAIRYRAEVEAALAEAARLGFPAAAPTVAYQALCAAINELLERYLDNPAAVDADEVLALEIQVAAAGQWCEQVDRVDQWADSRAATVALLAKIRESCGRSYAPTRGPDRVANSASEERKLFANTRGIYPPFLRGRHSGGFIRGSVMQGFAPQMSVTQDRQNTAAIRDLRERKTFAIRMRIARDERRWTQSQMGEFLEVRAKEINRFEHAYSWGRPPSQRTRIAFAIKLGKPRDWFVTEVEADERLEKLTSDEEASL